MNIQQFLKVTRRSRRGTAPVLAQPPAAEPVVEAYGAEIAQRRDIIDRRTLMAKLEDALAAAPEPKAARADILYRLKEALANGRAEIERRFLAGQSGGEGVVRATTYMVDQLVRIIFDIASARVLPAGERGARERLAIVAVGGYGRAELAPHSDLDLLFLLPDQQTPREGQLIEWMLYLLWDLGLKVGHATRTVDECLKLARQDLTIRTGLIDARYLYGEQSLFADLKTRFRSEVVRGSESTFIAAKLAERTQRHKRMGDSRYVVEPNIKDGKGGLRDLQTLFWIAKYVHSVDAVEELAEKGVFSRAETRKFAKAHEFLWTLRAHLHMLTDRPEERLTFDVQGEIARRMGYTDHRGARGVERFMKHYYLTAKDVGDLTRIYCAALEVETERKPRFSMERLGLGRLSFRKKELSGFEIESGRLKVGDNNAFSHDPVAFLRLFRVAQEHDLEIHPSTLRLIRQNLKLIDAKLRADPEANRLFLEVLTDRRNPEITLRQMNEAGVFGRFVPEFGRVVAQTQHDMYHVYTVDEHTLFAIGMLHRIETGELKEDQPVAAEAIRHVQSRRALYVAILLHDIAKGRGGDHSELGAEIGAKLGPRLGLTPEETESVVWLVRYHLAMSSTAFKRDIMDPQTIRDFVALVQSPERLKLLLCLTVADIRAVGPNVWNAWKATLLSQLYYRAEEVLLGTSPEEGARNRIQAAQQALRAALVGWGEDEIARHLERGYPAYWLTVDLETQARHAALVRGAERDGLPLAIDTRIDRGRGITEITVYTTDHPGLFSQIAGALALVGANIVAAQIFTMSNGMALDTFWIQEVTPMGGSGGAFDRPEKLAKLSAFIDQSLTGRLRLREALAERPMQVVRARMLPLAPRVIIDNEASANFTLVEVNGRDRPGLLYELTRTLTSLGLQISTAKIATYGERAVDVFYVKDVFGLKLENKNHLQRLRDRLLEVLADPDVCPGAVAARAARNNLRRPRAASAAE